MKLNRTHHASQHFSPAKTPGTRACSLLILCLLSINPCGAADDADDEIVALKQWLSSPPCFSLIRYSVTDKERKDRFYLLAVCGDDYVFKETQRDLDFSIPISATN